MSEELIEAKAKWEEHIQRVKDMGFSDERLSKLLQSLPQQPTIQSFVNRETQLHRRTAFTNLEIEIFKNTIQKLIKLRLLIRINRLIKEADRKYLFYDDWLALRNSNYNDVIVEVCTKYPVIEHAIGRDLWYAKYKALEEAQSLIPGQNKKGYKKWEKK